MADQRKMQALAIIGAVLLVLCCVGAFFAFTNGSKQVDNGAVAATVNGTPIYEKDVTVIVQTEQEQMSATDEDAWKQLLAMSGLTPSDVRSQVIDSLVSQELVRQGASELGIAVDDAEVDDYIAAVKANFADEDTWKKALQEANYTEESFRQSVNDMLVQQAVSEHFQASAKPNEEELVQGVQYYATYFDGSKRSSHILIRVEDASDETAKEAAREEAQKVLDQINSGAMTFEEAAAAYSADTSSAETGGDVGWDRAASFVASYQEALDGLEVGKVSGVVESEYGFHIIKCTDLYRAPENPTSIDQLPESIRDSVESMLVQQAASKEYSDWLEGLKESANIVINEMPSDVPYNVDMSDVV